MYKKIKLGITFSSRDFIWISEMLRTNSYIKNNIGISQIVHGSALSKNVDEIWLIKIDSISSEKNNSLFSLINLFLKRSLIFVCTRIENIAAKFLLNMVSKPFIIDQVELEKFKSKVKGYLNVDQIEQGFFSYTSVSKQMKKIDLDIILRGSGLKIEKGDILHKGSRHGVLSIHHGYNITNRGGPVGFWEVFFNEHSGITSQILTNELDGGKVVTLSMLNTKITPELNSNNIYHKTSNVIQHSLAIIAENKLIPDSLDTSDLFFRDILKIPNFFTRLLSFLFTSYKIFKLFNIRIFRKILSKSRWNINPKWWIKISSNRNIRFSLWPQLVSSDKPSNWLADPFLIKISNKIWLLYEKKIQNINKGEIWYSPVYSKDNKITFGEQKQLMSNDYHLSYPFTFERESKAYCIPENSTNGVILYEIKKKTNGLKMVPTRKVLEGLYNDPTLLTFEDNDYLFVTEKAGADSIVLSIWISSDIRYNKLELHPLSPVVVDSRFGRSAGRIFFENGKIIRPSQDLTFRYGEKIIFSEIKISPRIFSMSEMPGRLNHFGNISSFHHYEKAYGLYVHDYIK